MNPELLLAIDLGFGMGLYSVLHILGVWGLLALRGEAHAVGKIGIMTGLSDRPLILRRVGDTWLELGFMPGGYLQKRDAVADLYDTLPLDEKEEAPAQEPLTALDGGGLRSAYSVTEEELAARPAIYDAPAEADKTEEAFIVPNSWNWLSVGLSLLIWFGCLVAAAGEVGLGTTLGQFAALFGRGLGVVFWIGDGGAWAADFLAEAAGHYALAWGMAWLIAATLLARIPELLKALLPRGSKFLTSFATLQMLLGAFVFVRMCMLMSVLADSFWGSLGLYLLGGFACQFVLYWVVLAGLRAVLGRKA